jgi:SAM-dependent methyltransferase
VNEAAATRVVNGEVPAVMRTAECCCPACDKVAQNEPLERSNESALYACAGCDLQFWHPVKLPSAAWYEATYKGRDATELPLEPGHIFFLNDPRAPKKGRLLDMGCGNGNFLAAARDAGFDVTGFEHNKHAVEFAKKRYGLKNVSVSAPEDFQRSRPRETFDVVTFFEVLEHQETPQCFLDIAKSLISENGYIALSVPDRTRWQVGTDTLDYPPNHLTRWSPRALQNFLERNGFEVVTIRQESLTVRRAAQMLGAFFKTGMVSRVAGQEPPKLADFAEMPITEIEQKVSELAGDRRQALVMRLAAWKSRVMLPVAFFLVPFLRMRGYTGVYLYCLVRRKAGPASPLPYKTPTRRDVSA